MTSVKEDARTELALMRSERDAFHRLARLKLAVDDGQLLEVARSLWAATAAALCAHRARS